MKIEYAQIKEGIRANSSATTFGAKAYLGVIDGKIYYVMEDDDIAFEELFDDELVEDDQQDDYVDFVMEAKDFDLELDTNLQIEKEQVAPAANNATTTQQPKDIHDTSKYALLPNVSELINKNELTLAFAEKFLPDRYDTFRNFLRSSGGMVQINNLINSLNATEDWQSFRETAYRQAIQKWLSKYSFELI